MTGDGVNDAPALHEVGVSRRDPAGFLRYSEGLLLGVLVGRIL